MLLVKWSLWGQRTILKKKKEFSRIWSNSGQGTAWSQQGLKTIILWNKKEVGKDLSKTAKEST